MKKFPDNSVDLIYLDPPFKSDEDYNILFGDDADKEHAAQYQAFTDTWSWNAKAEKRYQEIEDDVTYPARNLIMGFRLILGKCGMLAYLMYMADRLLGMRRLMKPTSSIYLHCDPTACSHLKIAMDDILDVANFRNNIVWCYPPKGKPPNLAFHRKHDDILFYGGSKSEGVFNRPYTPLTDEQKAKFSFKDSDGRRYKEFRGVRTYLDKVPGRPVPCWWTDIGQTGQSRIENLGFPTQKPVKLLQRIIETSTNPNDVVLDPFCGCGTTIEAAIRTNRRWIGIDISILAVDVIRYKRLKNRDFKTVGIPEEMAAARRLAKDDPFQFEAWAVSRIPGIAPNKKKQGDDGIDGRGILLNKVENCGNGKLVVAQVKGGRYNAGDVREFCHAIADSKAVAGVFITLDPISPVTATAAIPRPATFKYGVEEYDRLQFFSIADYFDGKRVNLPSLKDPRARGGSQQMDYIAGDALL